jgi:hypothetical protein
MYDLKKLAALEARYNGPIPQAMLDTARRVDPTIARLDARMRIYTKLAREARSQLEQGRDVAHDLGLYEDEIAAAREELSNRKGTDHE